MLIQNFKQLQTNRQKKIALSILEKGLEAGMPDTILQYLVYKNKLVLKNKVYSLGDYEKIYVIAVGKAAFSMAHYFCKRTKTDGGIIVIPNYTKYKKISGFKIIKSSHPIPNKKSTLAAKSIITFLCSRNPKDLVIFLFSGGASSLIALPDGITLSQKQTTTRQLLRSGATINEINCVRKHLSKIKGGKLGNYVKCDALSLIMSDVIGNDLSSVVSGLTYGDDTTFSDAKKILEKYHIEKLVPRQVMQHIRDGIGKKEGRSHVSKIQNHIICDNNVCLEAMKRQARKLGYSVIVLYGVTGNVITVSKRLSSKIKSRSCLIFGGETTVTVKGKGKGGRNQELALRLGQLLGKKGIKSVIACVGTDGIDGNTDAAGAITESNASEKIKPYLEKNDSHHYFKKYGGLIYTGPTGTNLVDIGIVLS